MDNSELPFSDETYQNYLKAVSWFENTIKEFTALDISLENINIAAYERSKNYVAEVESILKNIEKKIKK